MTTPPLLVHLPPAPTRGKSRRVSLEASDLWRCVSAMTPICTLMSLREAFKYSSLPTALSPHAFNGEFAKVVRDQRLLSPRPRRPMMMEGIAPRITRCFRVGLYPGLYTVRSVCLRGIRAVKGRSFNSFSWRLARGSQRDARFAGALIISGRIR